MNNRIRKITPQLNSKGLFEVRQPFQIKTTMVYEVIAIREFPDLWSEHIDIFEKYYEPEGLTQEDYQRDVKLNAAIVSLKCIDGIIYVPDTYIVSYPNLNVADYKHIVLGISLGPIPNNHNLTGLVKDIEELVSTFLGVKPKVTTHVAPMRDALTTSEAKQLEKIRKGNVEVPKTAELKYREARNSQAAYKEALNQRILLETKK